MRLVPDVLMTTLAALATADIVDGSGGGAWGEAWVVPWTTGLVLGLGAAVPPGPVNLEIARRTARGGWPAGVSVGLGAVTVDVGFAILLSVGLLAVINSIVWIRLPVTLFGIALLVWLAIGALRDSSRQFKGGSLEADREDGPGVGRPSPRGGYITGLLMCGSSPYQALFWLTVVPAVMAGAGQGESSSVDSPERLLSMESLFLCVGVFMATLLWVMSFAGLLHGARRLTRSHWLPTLMDLVGGVLLLGFAGWSTWRVAGELL